MTDSNKREAQTEQIQLRAYEVYLERGGADGHDLEDWILAERELTTRPETKRVTSREQATGRATERAAGRETTIDITKSSFSSVVNKRP
jgi:hypothetical protein